VAPECVQAVAALGAFARGKTKSTKKPCGTVIDNAGIGRRGIAEAGTSAGERHERPRLAHVQRQACGRIHHGNADFSGRPIVRALLVPVGVPNSRQGPPSTRIARLSGASPSAPPAIRR
jgi:hypothetical protein